MSDEGNRIFFSTVRLSACGCMLVHVGACECMCIGRDAAP